MTGGSANADLLNYLDTLSRVGVIGSQSDGQLLERFVAGQDGTAQAAFTALVERHGPMVLDLCRRALGNAHDAQDSFQATFLILARRAASVRNRDSVASWLFGVARRVASRAKADAARRRAHERRGAEMRAVEPSHPEEWAELYEEIGRLPEKYRAPILLCYLEGLTTEAAAEWLGCPKGTVLSRLSRGRDRLRAGLIRRGLTVPAGLMAAGLAHEASAAVPPTLLASTVRSAPRFAASRVVGGGAVSSPAGALTAEVLRTMLMTRLRVVAAMILIGVGALAVGVAVLSGPTRSVGASPRTPRAKNDKPSGGGGTFSFQKVGLSADDLVEVTGLDVYKFRVDIPKGQQFRVVFRELQSEASGRVLFSTPFEKLEDGPSIIRVSFLRRDRGLQGVLLSQEDRVEFRLNISGTDSAGLATYVPLPLADRDPTRKTLLWHKSDEQNRANDIKETRLLTIVASEPGNLAPPPTSYPRGELLIVREQR